MQRRDVLANTAVLSGLRCTTGLAAVYSFRYPWQLQPALVSDKTGPFPQGSDGLDPKEQKAAIYVLCRCRFTILVLFYFPAPTYPLDWTGRDDDDTVYLTQVTALQKTPIPGYRKDLHTGSYLGLCYDPDGPGHFRPGMDVADSAFYEWEILPGLLHLHIIRSPRPGSRCGGRNQQPSATGQRQMAYIHLPGVFDTLLYLPGRTVPGGHAPAPRYNIGRSGCHPWPDHAICLSSRRGLFILRGAGWADDVFIPADLVDLFLTIFETLMSLWRNIQSPGRKN